MRDLEDYDALALESAHAAGVPVDLLIPVAEAARRVGVERQSFYRYVKSGKVHAYRIAGRLLIDPTELVDLTVPPPGTAPKGSPSKRIWTPAMTRKRLMDWNWAVSSGTFDLKGGRISAAKIHAWEKKQGWTRGELLAALERLADEEEGADDGTAKARGRRRR